MDQGKSTGLPARAPVHAIRPKVSMAVTIMQGRIQDFVKGGGGGGGCTLHGQNVIRETQHIMTTALRLLYIDTILYNYINTTRKEKGFWETVCNHRPPFSTCFWSLRWGGGVRTPCPPPPLGLLLNYGLTWLAFLFLVWSSLLSSCSYEKVQKGMKLLLLWPFPLKLFVQ